MKKNKIVIVGGGITGLSAAYYLLKAGWEVTLLDKGDFSHNCSHINAGMIVPSHFIPLAAPGIISKGIRWLFDKKSPFYMKPSLDPTFIKWGWSFIKHAKEKYVEQAVPGILALNLLGKKEYARLSNGSEFNFSYLDEGILMLYRTPETEKEQLAEAKRARDLKLDCRVLSAVEIQELESQVKLDIRGGVWYKSDAIIRPSEIMEQLLENVRALGAEIFPNHAVDHLDLQAGQIKKVFSGTTGFTGDKFLFATGHTLTELAKLAGISVPVMPGKGYSFMTDRFQGKLRYAALLLDDKVSITPMGDRVRVGGTMELGSEDAKIKMYKIEGMTQAVNRYYPEIGLGLPSAEEIHYGYRPCSPDGLPYLGSSKKVTNLILAGGAGMMGMSSGPAMGKLASELAQGVPLSLKIDMFDPERFN